MKDKGFNAYQEFKKVIDLLENEENKRICQTLISQAQNYYSIYQQTKKLSTVEEDMKGIYEVTAMHSGDGGYMLRLNKNLLDIDAQLALDFYYQCILHTFKKYKSFREYIDNADKFLNILKANNKSSIISKAENTILEACKLAQAQNVVDSSELYIDVIEDVAKQYFRYIHKIYPEEKCFNEIYSKDFIKMVTESLENGDKGIILTLSPVWRNLCSGVNEFGIEPKDAYIYDNAFTMKRDEDNKPRRKYSTSMAELQKRHQRLLVFESEFDSFMKRKKKYNKMLGEFQLMNIRKLNI